MKPNHVGSAVPVASVLFRLAVIAVDQNRLPGASAFLIHHQTLAWNRAKCAVWLFTVRNPLLRLTAVILGVIEILEREPLSLVLGRVGIIDTQLREQL